MKSPRETPWEAHCDTLRDEPAEAPGTALVDPRREHVLYALCMLFLATGVSVVVNLKTEWRTETIRLDKDIPGFASTYAGARVDAFMMCYTIGRDESCHSYHTPSKFNSINTTDGSITGIMLAGCQLLDDGRNMYDTQIPFSGGFAKFLRRFCDSGAPTWAPWVHFAAVTGLLVAIVALLTTRCGGVGRRCAVPLAWTATVAACVASVLQLAIMVGWALGLGFNAMDLGGCFWTMIMAVPLSCLSAVSARDAIHPTADEPDTNDLEPAV